METKPVDGILKGTDDIINSHFGDSGYSFDHGTLGKKLAARPEGFSAHNLISDLVSKIEQNLKSARNPESGIKLGNSSENWREKSPTTEHAERKGERACEHKLANIIGKDDQKWIWWNQMPLASGLVGHRSDRTSSVDLVGKGINNPKHYRLVELKINRGAGGPLFALMEIVRYGLIYLVLRKNQDEKWLNGVTFEAPIFQANQIDLCVLAPSSYFDGYKLAWLENELKGALAGFCHGEFGGGLTMGITSYRPPGEEALEEIFIKEWEKAY